MAVFAIAQVLHFDVLLIELAAELGALGHIGFAELLRFKVHARQVIADRAVILADAIERGYGQSETQFVAQLAIGFQLPNHVRVLAGVGHDAHVFPVLGGRADHGGAADVDVFDRVGQRTTGLGHGGFKGIEVDDQQINRVDVVRLQSSHVLGRVATRQQAAVHFGVQGFHTAIKHFGKACDFGHLGHGQALFGQELGSAAGRDEAHAQGVQVTREFDDASFVRDGDECFHGVLLKRDLFDEFVIEQFFTQGVAVQPQPFGGT